MFLSRLTTQKAPGSYVKIFLFLPCSNMSSFHFRLKLSSFSTGTCMLSRLSRTSTLFHLCFTGDSTHIGKDKIHLPFEISTKDEICFLGPPTKIQSPSNVFFQLRFIIVFQLVATFISNELHGAGRPRLKK